MLRLSQVSILPSTIQPQTPSPCVEPTNTLVITQVPRNFFQPIILQALRDFFAVYGEIMHWVPISSFARILLVYHDVGPAEQAKASSDPLVIQPDHGYISSLLSIHACRLIAHFCRAPTVLRVYRAEPHRPLSPQTPDDQFLKPPPLERNFLISPPGSPPVGWEPIREDPPNSRTLAEDLVTALNRLKCREKHGNREVLLEPEDGIGVGVYVEDCDSMESDEDDDSEMDFDYGTPNPSRMRWKPVPTAMPPMPVMLR